MDTVTTVGAIILAIALKILFFYFYAKNAEKKAPKKSVPFEVVQKGAQPSAGAKHILVTGGCGFLGSAIVRQLHQRLGDKVSIVVLDTAVHAKFGALLPEVTYYRGDICTYSHIRSAVSGCECVIHTAALVGASTVNEATLFRVNEQGTRNVVEACLEKDVKSLVYTSSASVMFSKAVALPYGGGGVKDPILERNPARPSDDLCGGYARSKAAAERLVLAANSHVLHVVVLRPGGVYGHGDSMVLTPILEGKPHMGYTSARVPFVWVEDAARAHVDAAEQLLFPKPGAQRIHGRAYHICHDPVRDPFVYGEFGGGPLGPEYGAGKHEKVKAAEAAAGVREPPPGVNAYGRKYNSTMPCLFFRTLAHLNYFFGQAFGVVLLHSAFTPDNLYHAVNDWPCDVSDARSVLGWEPTPWRVVAARLGAEAAAGGGASRGAPAAAGKAKPE